MKRSLCFGLISYLLFVNALWGLPAQVILIRHGEKPVVGNEINLKGQERAAALVPFFLGDSRVLQFGTPIAIFAQQANNTDHSLRPIQTVEALARRLKLRLNTQFTHEEYRKMVELIKNSPDYQDKMVLICWEHHSIPLIAKALGAKSNPSKWHGDLFDRLWIVTYNQDKTVDFQDLPQKLMFGDSLK